MQVLQIVLAALATLFFWWLYRRSLSYPYQFDDISNVIQNRAIRYLTHPRIFLENINLRERPVTNFSYALNYASSELSLSGFRVWNLLIHLGNAALVWRLGSRFLSSAPALFAGALFLLHPLAVDSAVYLSARSSMLALFFQLLALCLYAEPRQGFRKWLAFMICAMLAFLSKESAATTALLLILLDRQCEKRRGEVIPYLAPMLLGGLALISLKISFLANASTGIFQVQGQGLIGGYAEFLRLQISLWPKILSLFLRPSMQAIDHELNFPASWLDRDVLLGALILATLVWAVLRHLRSPAKVYFAAGWILLSMLPTNSIFPVLDPLADRFLYVALPGVCWLFAWMIAPALQRLPAMLLAMALLFGMGIYFTKPRIEVWRSPTSLWSDAYEKYPDKYRVVHNYSHAIVKEGGDIWLSVQPLVIYLAKQAPGNLTFQQQESMVTTIANTYRARFGNIARLHAALLEVLPGFWGEYIFLKALMPLSEPQQWLGFWQRARESFGASFPDNPRDPFVRMRSLELMAGEYLRQKGKYAEALRHLEPTFTIFPERHMYYWTARDRLAGTYLGLGRKREATEQYAMLTQQYKAYKNYHLPALRQLVELYREAGDLDKAVDAAGELVQFLTDDPEIRKLYADLLAARKDRHAEKQRREAEFYSRHAIRPDELREAIKP